jgi:hypothetical protein
VGLYGAIYDALPRHLAQRLSLDAADGIRVILRPGQTFWFRPNTAVSVIVARIVEETSGCHAMPVPCPAATPARDIVAWMRHDGCGGRAGKVGLLTGIEGASSSAAHSSGSATPIVDPDPAGIGTYLVSAVLLALGIAIFLYILIGEMRGNPGSRAGRVRGRR